MKHVLVCTNHKAVFVGKTKDDIQASVESGVINLTDARMVIHWGTTQGVGQLASTGPTHNTIHGAKTRHVCTSGVAYVFDLSPDASAAWDLVDDKKIQAAQAAKQANMSKKAKKAKQADEEANDGY